MYRWPGCEMTIHGISLDHCQPLIHFEMTIKELEENIMHGLERLANDEADFVGMILLYIFALMTY